MKRSLIFLAFASLILSSCKTDPCSSKSSFLNSFEALVDETAQNWKEYSEKDWKEKDAQIERYTEECYANFEDELTEEEKKEFWVNNAKFQFRRNGKDWAQQISDGALEFTTAFNDELVPAMEEMAKDFKNAFDEDFVNDLKNVFDEDFKNELREVFDEDFKNDLKNAFKELGNGLKEMGEELEKTMEKSK